MGRRFLRGAPTLRVLRRRLRRTKALPIAQRRGVAPRRTTRSSSRSGDLRRTQGAPLSAAVFTAAPRRPHRAAGSCAPKRVRPSRTLPESILEQPVRPLRAHAALSPRRSSRIIAHPAGVAQLVEQRIRNAWVGGSIPFSGTNDCSAFGCDFDDRAGVSRQERLRTGQAFEQNPCLTNTSKTRFGRLAQR